MTDARFADGGSFRLKTDRVHAEVASTITTWVTRATSRCPPEKKW